MIEETEILYNFGLYFF